MYGDFERFIGIDYSGAEVPTARLKTLQVYICEPGGKPVKRMSPGIANNGRPFNWTRKEVAEFLKAEVVSGRRFLAGIDHGFSFPKRYFERYRLKDWPSFLADFVHYWPTHQDHTYVDFIRDGALVDLGVPPPGLRAGLSNWLRLCEQWTSSAKSVFHFDVQGSVAKSTHAGIPWLKWLRDEAGNRLHFWPFDGWQVPPDKSLLAEIYPSVFRNRYPREERTVDEHDAYASARWMADMSARGVLNDYFSPPLTLPERELAALEGWILGIR